MESRQEQRPGAGETAAEDSDAVDLSVRSKTQHNARARGTVTTAVAVRIGPKLKLALRLERLDPALHCASDGRMIVIDSAVDDCDANAGAGAIAPGLLRSQHVLWL